MAGRIRSIRGELREWEPYASLTDAAARLFPMIVTLADDHGRCGASPRFLNGAVFFVRPKPANVIGQLLAELEAADLIRRYSAKGGTFLVIVGWFDKSHVNYQYIKKRQAPRYPAPNPIGDGHDDRHDDRRETGADLDLGSGNGSLEREERSLPSDWQPNEEHRQLAFELKLSLQREASKFREWSADKNSLSADHDARFKVWLRRGAEYATRDEPPMLVVRGDGDQDKPPPLGAWGDTSRPPVHPAFRDRGR